MTKTKLQTLKGFRDFLPEKKRQRDFIVKKIVEVFETFGFEPLQTPTLEYATIILGKYGDEADKMVYSFKDRGGRQVALPYDQTVPTSRVLAQYKDKLPQYFRRYQIQSVFRADKPQKGRYREFTQCDIDIFGSTSSLADAEIIACTYFAFKNIGFPSVVLKINDRQILFKTLKSFATSESDIFSIIQIIDKLDKKSEAEVITELIKKGLKQTQAQEALEKIKSAKQSEKLKQIITTAVNLGLPQAAIKFSPTLARGLDYYTGIIFEVIIPEYPIGSFAGGGRYDNLIKQLSDIDIPAVGIAFGFDRVVEAAEKLNLIPTKNIGTQVLVAIFDQTTQAQSLQTATQLRQAGIKTEIYPQLDKLSKQLKYANKRSIPFVIIIGEEEFKKKQITLKEMKTGKQEMFSLEKLLKILQQSL